ncbi:MAG: hypothetical protein HZA63_03855 [Rhodocyclales bacterium]|nr:hypothetical protein [Rhodocyclales bacterium]
MKTLLALMAGLVSTGAAMAFSDLALDAPGAIQTYFSTPPTGTSDMVVAGVGLMLYVAHRRVSRSIKR